MKPGAGLPPTVGREPLHTRSIEIRGYKRTDGLYDIEGHLVDTKPFDFRLAAGLRPAGQPIHDMWLRITVDRELKIVDAAAAMDGMPYVGDCDRIVPAYRKLVGLAIRPGYTQKVKELLAGVRGCTHITELDRCHALESSQPAVARYYPKWYTGKEPIEAAGEDHH